MSKSIPCAWCGAPVQQSDGPGRSAKYCCRSHRQRAYESQTKFYTRATLMALAELLGWECYICGVPLDEDSIQFDHVVPLSLGGPDEPENIRPCCLTCNAEKGAKLVFVPAESA